MKLNKLFLLCLIWLPLTSARAIDASKGYDIIVLAGQSNMAGRGALATPNDTDGAPDPANISMWDPVKGIVTAQDPIIHPEQGYKPTGVGMGMSFAKSYLAWLRATGHSGRRVLLVGVAWGGTSFVEDVGSQHHRWVATDDSSVGGDLFRGAVQRANAAIAAAQGQDSSSAIAAILWHQGESDLQNGGAAAYPGNHVALMQALRSRITGATGTPIVVGEMTPCFWAQCAANVKRADGQAVAPADLSTMQNYLHDIDKALPHASWVSSAGLTANADNIHFDSASQRELGRRYFSKFWQASMGMAPADFEMEVYNGRPFNVGRSIDFDPSFATGTDSARQTGNLNVRGTVSMINDASIGNGIAISLSNGQLGSQADARLFNASYTKMAWIRLDSTTYRNHILSAQNPTQSHYFYFSNQKLSAGHSSPGREVNVYVSNPAALPLNVWTHVAVTYDAAAAQMVLYVNGLPVSTANSVPVATAAAGVVSLDLSAYGSRPLFGLDGSMSAVKAYNSAFSADAVRKLVEFERLYATGYGKHLR